MNPFDETRLELDVAPAPNCLLCGALGVPFMVDLMDQLFGVPGVWSLSVCPACGFVWMDPKPTPENIGKAYQRYYTHADEDPADRKPTRPPFLRRKIRRLYRWALRRLGVSQARDRILGMFLQGVPKGSLLEIGCGNGARLAELATQGWQVLGQEVDPHSADHARSRHGVPILVGSLQFLALESETFDCILMNHVLEHLHDPVETLKECHRLLKPRGRLVVVTPNVRSMGLQVFGTCWRGLEAPRHIHLFRTATLARAAQMAGFVAFETFTSAAHAELLAVQSLDIRAHGITVMGQEPSWNIELQAMAFQLREAWAFRTDPDIGEEAVLVARRKL